MTIKQTEQNNQTIITLDGMLDSSSSSQFQDVINLQLEKDTLDIVVDLQNLTYTSSQGIRTILTLIKAVMSRNGKLLFRNICPAVREVLDMSGISQAMTIE